MSLVGDKRKCVTGWSILRETQADEIMVNGQIFDHQARLHSFDWRCRWRNGGVGFLPDGGSPYPAIEVGPVSVAPPGNVY
jgi:hypothetical protein